MATHQERQVEQRVFNFSAGPAAIPLPVLERARDELLCLPGCGASVMEISHRSEAFEAILASAASRLRSLLSIPDNYQVLFLQGGSRLQFSMTALNLMPGATAPAEYLITGAWSSKALDEGRKAGETKVLWDGKPHNYDRLPDFSQLSPNPQAPYFYFCSNETIQGVQMPVALPLTTAPLVADLSSDFLSREVPVEKYGLIYACSQKNAGPAGVTVVIVREDLMDRASDDLPGYLIYREHAKNNSMYNTPPTFAIYMLDLVCQWLQEGGGLAAIDERNRAKAGLLYDAIDASGGFYQGHAAPDCRSKMNVTFRIQPAENEAAFLEGARQQGLDSLEGHRSVGGMRASIYNAMPPEGVAALRQYMLDFHAKHG